jgi:hypothetical protein
MNVRYILLIIREIVNVAKVYRFRWFSLGTPVSSTNTTDRHDITEILLKEDLSIINYNVYTQYVLHCIHTVWIILYTHSMNDIVYIQYELYCIHTVWITLYKHSMDYIVCMQCELYCIHTVCITLYAHSMNYIILCVYSDIHIVCIQCN